LCNEDETGQPLAGTLKIVNPFLLSTERADDGSLRWVIGAEGASAQDKVVFGRDGRVTLGPVTYKIVALRNPHFGTDVEGHTPGVFEAHPSTFNLGGSIETYAQGTFRSGIPAGYLQVDQTMNSMTQEQADALKGRWMASHGGDRRSIAVLNAFTKFVPLQMSPVDSALGEVKRLNIGDVAFAFGLDPLTLGVSLGNSATYSSRVDSFLAHRDYSLAPWISAVQDVLTALLPGTQGVLVDLDKFVNPTAKERYDGYAVAISSGVLTPDECREMEGLPPLPRSAEPVPGSAPSSVPAPVDETPTDIRSRRPQPWR
jgi:phage portal protein BeeE